MLLDYAVSNIININMGKHPWFYTKTIGKLLLLNIERHFTLSTLIVINSKRGVTILFMNYITLI